MIKYLLPKKGKFYKANLLDSEAKPNDCHAALVELGRKVKLKAIVTENINKNEIECIEILLKFFCSIVNF